MEVSNSNSRPRSIYTRYGQWMILGSCSGSFEKVFEVVQKEFNLKKIEELSSTTTSCWAIQSWDGKPPAEPIKANERRGEFIPYNEAKALYQAFKEKLNF